MKRVLTKGVTSLLNVFEKGVRFSVGLIIGTLYAMVFLLVSVIALLSTLGDFLKPKPPEPAVAAEADFAENNVTRMSDRGVVH